MQKLTKKDIAMTTVTFEFEKKTKAIETLLFLMKQLGIKATISEGKKKMNSIDRSIKEFREGKTVKCKTVDELMKSLNS